MNMRIHKLHFSFLSCYAYQSQLYYSLMIIKTFWYIYYICFSPAAAAAKSLQSCLTLCDPIDGSPPCSSVYRILQARVLEWVAISFYNACLHTKSLQPCPTLCDPIDCSPPGSSLHWILWARIPEWVAIFSSHFSPTSVLLMYKHSILWVVLYYHFMSTITWWQIDGETVETVADFIFGGSKITADSDCSHEIKRRLLLGRKVMTHLDSIL